MTIIEDKNFSGRDIADIPLADEYYHCNFSRKQPVDNAGVFTGVRLFPGDDTPRTFRSCNMTNCELPPGSTMIKGNNTIAQFGVLDHADVVTVDGLEVSRQNYTNMIHHGRYNPETGSYDYLPEPLVWPENH